VDFEVLELLAIDEVPSDDDAAEGLEPTGGFLGMLLPSIVGFLITGFFLSSEVPAVVADIEEEAIFYLKMLKRNRKLIELYFSICVSIFLRRR